MREMIKIRNKVKENVESLVSVDVGNKYGASEVTKVMMFSE